MKFVTVETEEKAQGKYETIQISATDADADDVLSFELLEISGEEGHGIILGDQPRSASVRKISLRVPKKFEPTSIPISMRVTDDGLPAKSDEIKFSIVFEAPKKQGPKKETPKPKPVKFATQTYVRGLMKGNDGRWMAMLSNQINSETYQLAVGDSLDLDDQEWKVVSVDEDRVTFDVGGDRRSYTTDLSLAEPLKAL